MNCATTDLSPYVPDMAMPWNQSRAIHLFRRIGFGTDIDTVLAALSQSPADVVDQLVQEAVDLPLSPVPDFADKVFADYGLAVLESTLEKDGWARDWIRELQNNGLRGRMALFWHNHFVTRFDVYLSSSYLYQYHKLLQTHALGNFKEFVREIGLTPAMLVFLNGVENVATSPNENYAREVYELFTLGVDNGYTQNDIVETARALSGFTNVPEQWGPILFDPATHDGGMKTIFGQTGNWGYEEVVEILFEQRAPQIAEFIATKLYRHFVNPVVDELVVQELAAVFQDNDWEIAPLLSALFKSAHFFDTFNMSTIIPGHLEHTLIFLNEMNVEVSGLSVLGIYGDLINNGQPIFNPVDVAGWPGNRAWINTTSIGYRWNYVESQLGLITIFNFGYLAELVTKITDEEFDVEIVCRDLIHYFLPKGLQFEQDYDAALVNFKGEIPENYFEDGTWTVNYWAMPFQLNGLLKFINRMPEYQLK
ncbi:MAG: DUF1800 domain-containing protein [Bacteroidota bacterium]